MLINRLLTINRHDYFKLELNSIRKNKYLWPVKNTNIYFPGIHFTCEKSSKQQNMRIHVVFMSHYAPAALLRAEKNIIKLGAIYIYIYIYIYTGASQKIRKLKGWLTVFFLGLIVFMGCSLACVHACFYKKRIIFHIMYLYSTPLCPFSDKRLDLFPVFMKLLLQKYAMGWDWLGYT